MMGELFAMSVAGAAMVLAVLIARALLLKRLPQWVFATLWALVVVRLLVPVWIPSPTSIYNLAVQPRAESSSQQPLQQSNQPADEEPTVSTQVAEPSMPSSAPEETGKEQGAGALERSAGAAQNASASEETGSPRDAGARSTASEAISAPSPEELFGLFDSGATLSAIVTVWATGAVGCAGFLAFSYLRLRRELDSSLPVEAPEARRWLDGNRLRVRSIRIRQSDRIGSPLTFGIVRPTIVVPRTFDWASDHARHTLAHELTHIRHFDTVFKFLLVAAACIHWFNPFAWAMLVFANRDIELACDEATVRRLGTESRFGYARSLLAMEESRISAAPLRAGFGGAGIKERIEVIMTTRRTSVFTALASALLVVGVPAAFATTALTVAPANDASTAQAPVVEDTRETEAAAEASTTESTTAEQTTTVDLSHHDIPATTYVYSDETWAAIVELWEYIQDESVSVADLRDAIAAKGLTYQDDPELFGTMGSDLRLAEARYGNDLAAFACNVLGSEAGMPLTDSMSFELEEGVAGLYYQVGASLNSDPSLVSALALHRTLANAFEQLGTLFDGDKLFYLADIYDQPTIMGYVLDDVVESLLQSDFPGVDLNVHGRYTFRPAGSAQAPSGSGSFSVAVEGARALDFAWPVNENGQTYGTSSDIAAYLPDGGSTGDAGYALLPDLVEMIGDNGVSGYVYKEDMYDFSEDGPRARAFLAAAEAGADSFEYTVPVYAQDGTTVVDEIDMGGTIGSATVVREDEGDEDMTSAA